MKGESSAYGISLFLVHLLIFIVSLLLCITHIHTRTPSNSAILEGSAVLRHKQAIFDTQH